MRVLFLTHMPHLVTLGGANKVIRAAAEQLARRGHSVALVGPLLGEPPGRIEPSELRRLFGTDGAESAGTTNIAGVRCTLCADGEDLCATANAIVQSFEPDVIVVSVDDPDQRLLAAAVGTGCRTVALAQTPATLPFGPASLRPDRVLERLLSDCDAVVANSGFLTSYVRDNSSVACRHVTIPTTGTYHGQAVDDPEAAVLMVNPSQVKGIDILLGVATRLPEHRFAVIPAWATNLADRRRLSELHNLQLLDPTVEVRDYMVRSRALLVPSLWLENVPLVIAEAMSVGLPVVASDIGGIPELAAGAAVLVPVYPLELTAGPGPGRRSALTPRQDVDRWAAAIRSVTTDPAEWRRRSELGLVVSRARAGQATIRELECELLRLVAEQSP